MERGISFSVPMVRALLDGRKTQTRRIMKVQPHPSASLAFLIPQPNAKGACAHFHEVDERGVHSNELTAHCPYGIVGDVLWVREPWQAWTEFDHLPPSEIPENPSAILHTADRPDFPWDSRKRQARFMCRWMSRLTLQITELRVQRLQDISEDDAKAEGLSSLTKDGGRTLKYGIPDADGLPGSDDFGWDWSRWCVDPVRAYAELWEQINGPGSWDQNPWLWCVTFEVLQQKGESQP